MKSIYFKTLIVFTFIFWGKISNGQNCYVVVDKLAGFEQELPILEQEACMLIDSLPEGFREDFKIFHFGLYLHNTKMQGGNDQFYQQMLLKASLLSDYYLIMVHQVYDDGHSEYYVDIKLPDNWLSNCYNQIVINTFKNSIKAKFKTLQNTYPLASDYHDIEVEGMKYIADKLGKFTYCCLLENNFIEESCTSCITAYDILNEMKSLGFEPYYAGQVLNSDMSEDQSCLCNESPPSLRRTENEEKINNTVLDNANLIFELDGIEYNFGEELNTWANQGFDAYVTKNADYCNQTEFQGIQSLFNNSEGAVWVHLWENPSSEGDDIVFIKINTSPSDINTPINEITIEPVIPDISASPPPPYKYKVVHRSFAPWDRFGSFPVIPNIHKARNNFHGDNRGFSLEETELIDGVTARIHQEMNMQLGIGEIPPHTDPNPFSSITKGYTNFQQTKWVYAPYPYTAPPSQEATQEDEAFGNPVGTKFSEISNDWTRIGMNFQGHVPLVKLFSFPPMLAPDIEWSIALSLGYDESNQYIYVSGIVTGKEFPAYEAYIEDDCGAKVFLHTFTAPCESEVGGELLNPIYDYEEAFQLAFEVSTQGCFTGEMFTVNMQNSLTTIEEWNMSNLLKPAAKDCLSNPCQGAYPNDGSDHRNEFNCGN